MKLCKKCNNVKSLDNFSKVTRNSDGRHTRCKLCVNSYMRDFYYKNPEKIKRRVKRYSQIEENHIRLKIYRDQWKKENSEKVKQYRKTFYCRLSVNLRARLWRLLKGYTKSSSISRHLGCSIPELKQHLESKFQPGMTWENWAINGWHIDHIRPLSSFDLTKAEDQKAAIHYTNLQPLWAKDNLQKSDKYNG